MATARCRAETGVLAARVDALQNDLMRKTNENRLLREQLVAGATHTPLTRGGGGYLSSPPSSSSADLQAKLDDANRVVLELRVQNKYWKNMVDTLQQYHQHQQPPSSSSTNTTPGSGTKKRDASAATSSPSAGTYALHTQSSLTKLKARSLDECHGRYLQAVSELKFICQDHVVRGKGAATATGVGVGVGVGVGSSPSSAATNRLVADILQAIDESTMKVDSMVSRLRRNNPGSDDAPLVGSPSSHSSQFHGATHDSGSRESYYERRYFAVHAECVDLRRQLAATNAQWATWKDANDFQRKSLESEIGHHYQRAVEVAEFEAAEKSAVALLERDAAAEALQRAQQERRAVDTRHAEELAALEHALAVARGQTADAQTRTTELEVELSIARGLLGDVEASHEELLRRLEEERRKGAAWMERAEALQSGLESATAAAQDAQVAYLRIDSESSHLRLELLRLRKLVTTST